MIWWRYPRQALVALVLASLAFMVIWIHFLDKGNQTRLVEVPAGQSGVSAEIDWSLVSYYSSASYDNYLGETTTALPGAVFVITQIQYDQLGTEEAHCRVIRLQGDKRKWSARSLTPTNTDYKSYCHEGGGVIESIFEVPESVLEEIVGVTFTTTPGEAILLQRP